MVRDVNPWWPRAMVGFVVTARRSAALVIAAFGDYASPHGKENGLDKITLHRNRLRARLLSRRLWRRRLVFWLGAVAIGVVSVLFAEAANWSQDMFARAVAWFWLLPLAVTPLGFTASAFLARAVFPGSQGSGIPQAIAARRLTGRSERRRLLSPKLIVGKIGLTLIGLLSGASIGREGPTVQVGAGIMLQVASWGRMGQERGLILAGSAAGIAAAFNTPLAGIVFAIEEMSRSFEQRTNGLVLYAVIIAGIASLGLLGNYSYFGSTSVTVSGPWDWAMVAACGIGGGLAGGAFSRLLLTGTRRARIWIAEQPGRRSLAFAASCGGIVALIGLLTGGATFGTGYEQARSAVEGHALPWSFWLAKFTATLVTAVSGIPGGIFAPSLAVGAGLGSWLGSLSGAGSSSLVAVLGMAGYFAGVVQAPMTAFIIIFEMTRNDTNVIPLMVAAMLGFATSKLVAPEALYDSLADGFVEDVKAHEPVSSGA